MLNKKTVAISVFIFIALFLAVVFHPEKKELSTDYFIFDNSDNYNSGIPFNYFLIEKKDNAVIYFLVNDYLEEDNFIYFSYIDGGLRDDFCYYNPNLKLAKINKTTHKIEDISIESNKRIFELLNKIEPSDKKWLSQKSNLCASPKNK